MKGKWSTPDGSSRAQAHGLTWYNRIIARNQSDFQKHTDSLHD